MTASGNRNQSCPLNVGWTFVVLLLLACFVTCQDEQHINSTPPMHYSNKLDNESAVTSMILQKDDDEGAVFLQRHSDEKYYNDNRILKSKGSRSSKQSKSSKKSTSSSKSRSKGKGKGKGQRDKRNRSGGKGSKIPIYTVTPTTSPTIDTRTVVPTLEPKSPQNSKSKKKKNKPTIAPTISIQPSVMPSISVMPSSSQMPSSLPSTTAPTCLECDDIPFFRTSPSSAKKGEAKNKKQSLELSYNGSKNNQQEQQRQQQNKGSRSDIQILLLGMITLSSLLYIVQSKPWSCRPEGWKEIFFWLNSNRDDETVLLEWDESSAAFT